MVIVTGWFLTGKTNLFFFILKKEYLEVDFLLMAIQTIAENY